MTFLLSDRLIFALGWAVLHALWLGTLLGLAGAVLLSALRRRSAATRYRAAYSLLLLFFASVAVSGGMSFFEFREEANNATQAIGYLLVQLEQPDGWQYLKHEVVRHCNDRLPWITGIWMIGLVLSLVRLGGGYWVVKRIRRRATRLQDDRWQQLTDKVAEKLGLHQIVTLAESAMIQTPVVAGHLKPMILMPLGLLMQLQPNQVEAILAHELAHVLRRDYLLNIIQSVIEAVLYFHPVVWWLSGVIRREREHCCDDLAIHACGTHPLVFAKALVSVQEQASARPQLALALGFASRRQQLLFRVQRILQPSSNKSNKMERSIASMLLLALITCISLGANTPARAALATVKERLAGIMNTDTTPTNKKVVMKNVKKFVINENGKDVQITISDGKVDQLIVDGAIIPAADYAKYDDITQPLLANNDGDTREMNITVNAEDIRSSNDGDPREMRIIVNTDDIRGGGGDRNRMQFRGDEGENIIIRIDTVGEGSNRRIERRETRTITRGDNGAGDGRTFIYRNGPEGSEGFKTIRLDVDDSGLAAIRRKGVVSDTIMYFNGDEGRVFDIRITDDQIDTEMNRLRGLGDDIRLEVMPELRELRIDADDMLQERRQSRGGSIEERLEIQEDMLREQRAMLREQERRLKEQERELKRLKKERRKG